MFKGIIILAVIAVVYGIPTPPPQTPSLPTTTNESLPTTSSSHPVAELPDLQTEVQSYNKNSPAAASQSKIEAKPILKQINGEEDPKNEKQDLEGAEFGWGLPKLGWGYPAYETYSYYPTYEYYPSYYYPSYRFVKYW